MSPKQTGRVICGRCRHPRPLHSNGKSACLARGCSKGVDGAPCPEFTLDTIVPVTEVIAADDAAAVPAARFQPPLAAAAGQ